MTTDKPMTMVERVARAICKACGDASGEIWKFDNFDASSQHEFIVQARTALEAMREPTQRMLDATLTDASAFTWRTMIDAALNEDQA